MNLTWAKLHRIAQIDSPWLTICCERWQDESGNQLDYWRLEQADSVIILPIWHHSIVLPLPFFRVGVNQVTYDFPGGRVLSGKTPQEMVPEILQRELGITATAIVTITPLNQTGWLINSSCSNQKLYGFSAEINSDYPINTETISFIFNNDKQGITALLEKLTCLQCRALLLEWLNTY